VLAFYSPDGRFDDLYTSNYVTLNVLDELKRLPGTTNVQIFGAKDYAMRIWLRPDRLAQLNLTTTDVVRAVQEQNAQFAAGRVGQAPYANGDQELVYTVTTRGRLADPAEFGEILVRSSPGGAAVRLKDVARIELGSKDYEFIGRYNGKSATLVGIFLQPGANAIDVAQSVTDRVDQLAARFPEGLAYSVAYDTTRFVEVSIKEVLKTLFEAMLLVFLVVYLFLQNWRATLIPIIAVPVSLLGTFAGLLMLGYSINTLTLFGMVLSIGIVVDDAIVVLENVERIMHEEKLNAREAAIVAMREVTSPIIAIVLVLIAVFVPIAFLGGLTGELYRQFAITISIAVGISGIVALTLTPSLCVMMLKREHKKPGRFFQAFNDFFARATLRYTSGVIWMIRRGAVALALFAGMVIIAGGLWRFTPGSLVPDEDQGFYIAAVILPDGATLQRTDKVVAEVVGILTQEPGQPGRGRVHRFRLSRRRHAQQRGDDLRHAEAVGRAQRQHAAAGRRVLHEDRPHQGSAGARVRAAGDLRARHRGRLRAVSAEPRRGRHRADAAGAAAAARAVEFRSDARRRADALARQRAAAVGRRRSRKSEVARRADHRRLCDAECDARQLLRQ
jgi:hydrophobe/amphiphile efflux-1 (HAE1) family protein